MDTDKPPEDSGAATTEQLTEKETGEGENEKSTDDTKDVTETIDEKSKSQADETTAIDGNPTEEQSQESKAIAASEQTNNSPVEDSPVPHENDEHEEHETVDKMDETQTQKKTLSDETSNDDLVKPQSDGKILDDSNKPGADTSDTTADDTEKQGKTESDKLSVPIVVVADVESHSEGLRKGDEQEDTVMEQEEREEPKIEEPAPLVEEKIDPKTTLQNQESEKEAFQNLVDENVKLKSESHRYKSELDVIKETYDELKLNVKELTRQTKEQSGRIVKLEAELARAKSEPDPAGEEKIKDLQQKLLTLATQDREKEKKLSQLQRELRETSLKLQSAEKNNGALPQNSQPQKSGACAIL